jgi:hypothetical protein
MTVLLASGALAAPHDSRELHSYNKRFVDVLVDGFKFLFGVIEAIDEAVDDGEDSEDITQLPPVKGKAATARCFSKGWTDARWFNDTMSAMCDKITGDDYANQLNGKYKKMFSVIETHKASWGQVWDFELAW